MEPVFTFKQKSYDGNLVCFKQIPVLLQKLSTYCSYKEDLFETLPVSGGTRKMNKTNSIF